MTFIHEKYISAPAGAPCDYSGSAYKYGGDNRSYDPNSSAYRTRLQTTLQWYNAGHAASSAATGVTHVDRTSDSSLVAQKQAPTTDMHIKTRAASSSETDLRFTWQAGDPFCHVGAIEGAFAIEVLANGSYTLVSGSQRDMPYYEIYIDGDGGASWTTVHQRASSNALCLVGAVVCPYVNMYGFGNSY